VSEEASKSVVFIGYPKKFGSYPKFERKVSKILSSLTSVSVIYLDDSRGLIQRYAEKNCKVVRGTTEISDSDEVSRWATHAIVFDGEQSLVDLAAQLEKKGANVRLINSALTTVVNKDRGEEFDVYIGRGSGWGNPYAIGFDGDRDEVIRKFAYDFQRDFLRGGAELKEKLKQHKGKRLGCHCAPAPCHGDILAEFLNSLDDGK
jgi:hypothetical protein